MWKIACRFLLSSITCGAPVASAAPADDAVAYRKDVRPILERRCFECHSAVKSEKGLRFDSLAALLRGGSSGPVVLSGDSANSLLIQRVTSPDPRRVMPRKGARLSADEIALLKNWIDRRPAELEAERGSHERRYQLALSPPALAPQDGENPIDQILAAYLKRHGVDPVRQVEDRVFARRVFLDVVGMLPTAAELAGFLRDAEPDCRARLVRRLLGDKRRYAEHRMTFWNDALRNDYQGTGYIDGGRLQITQWLFDALYENMPYDRFVAELVNPQTPASAGFSKGIVWRGVVNASQTPTMQAAQNVSQVFLGLNIKCASCHDSFINDWTLKEAYSLAAVFADEPLEMYRCDSPLGVTAAPAFLYPELADIDADADRPRRLTQLVAALTGKANGRFTRTIVNRLWAGFFGRGLIEPVDEMDNPAWHAALLEFLANDLIEHGYDLKHTMELMLTSRAYEMPSVDSGEQIDADFVFHGPLTRRMNAEQFVDAVRSLTGVWPPAPVASIRLPDEQGALATTAAKWIWDDPLAASHAENETVYFRAEFHLERMPGFAAAVITCDNSYTLYVNGVRLGGDASWKSVETYDLTANLRPGRNLIAVEAANGPAASANPAGLIFNIRTDLRSGETVTGMVSSAAWRCTRTRMEDWTATDFDASTWEHAVELGSFDAAPWRLGDRIAAARQFAGRPVRAVYMTADRLTTALGRPNREQIVTRRATAATTLQALELTNGAALHDILRHGGERLLRTAELQGAVNADRMIHRLFEHAMSRAVDAGEMDILREVIGESPSPDSVADLLWTLVMLPEFQLIR